MTDDLTARDVIALTVAESHDEPDTSPERVIAAVRKALPVCISEETCEPDDDHAREFLATLAAAGYTIVTTDDWEWAARHPDDKDPRMLTQLGREMTVERRAAWGRDGHTLVRRRPAGPWEVVPDAR